MHLQFCNQISRKIIRKTFSWAVVEGLSLAHVVVLLLFSLVGWLVGFFRRNVSLQTEYQAFLLWGGTEPVGRMQIWSVGALTAVFVAVSRCQ